MKKRIIGILLSIVMLLGTLPVAFAEAECEHTDADGNGYCDECGIAVESSVTIFALTPVTKTFKAGTNIKEAINGILASQNTEAAAMFYGDGTPVKDADTVPYGYDLLLIYPLLYYKAEPAVCGENGHKAYYYNSPDKMYYEDRACTKLIGFEDEGGLEAWLRLEDKGLIEATAEHNFVCADNSAKGHVCTNEGCKYFEKPQDHFRISLNYTYCEDCGAPCYKAYDNGPIANEFYAFANTFENDGQPLEYIWYYVGEDVTLEEPLIIAGEDVRFIMANGITFNAAAGYHCLPGCSFEVYYQSKNADEKGVFTGTEYKCYDAETDVYYAEHTEITDFICARCGECVCEHKNTEQTYKWSEDYSSCRGKAVCADCQTVLYDCEGDVESTVVKKGDCQTKTRVRYTAYFERGYTEKTVDTEYGAHNIVGSLSVYCNKCYCNDIIGTKANLLKQVDVTCSVTNSEEWLQLREDLKSVKTLDELTDIIPTYSELSGELTEDENALISAKTDIYNNMTNAAWYTDHPSAAYKCIMRYMPLFEAADSMQALTSSEMAFEEELSRLMSDKKVYMEKAMNTYLDEQGYPLIEESELYQVIYGIRFAPTREDIEDAFNSPTVEYAKKAAKRAIDEAAGENQSLLMQKLVMSLKKAVDEAETKEEVKVLKREGVASIEELLLREAEELTVLEETKEKAKKDIDEAAGDDPDDTVVTVAQTAKDLIDAANTVDEVTAVKDKWIAVIEGLVSDEDAALDYAKTAAKTEIRKAADGVFDDITDYEDAIDALDSVAEVIEKLAAILGEISDEKTAKLTAEAQAALDEVKAELANKKADLEKAEKDLAEANMKVTALQDALDKAKDEKAELEEELNKKQQELAEADKNHSAEVDSLKKEIAGLQKTIAEKDSEINSKQATIDSLNSQLDKAKEELEHLKDQGEDSGTDNVCSRCGKTHSDNFWGKIICFFNRIGNFFRNLF